MSEPKKPERALIFFVDPNDEENSPRAHLDSLDPKMRSYAYKGLEFVLEGAPGVRKIIAATQDPEIIEFQIAGGLVWVFVTSDSMRNVLILSIGGIMLGNDKAGDFEKARERRDRYKEAEPSLIEGYRQDEFILEEFTRICGAPYREIGAMFFEAHALFRIAHHARECDFTFSRRQCHRATLAYLNFCEGGEQPGDIPVLKDWFGKFNIPFSPFRPFGPKEIERLQDLFNQEQLAALRKFGSLLEPLGIESYLMAGGGFTEGKADVLLQRLDEMTKGQVRMFFGQISAAHISDEESGVDMDHLSHVRKILQEEGLNAGSLEAVETGDPDIKRVSFRSERDEYHIFFMMDEAENIATLHIDKRKAMAGIQGGFKEAERKKAKYQLAFRERTARLKNPDFRCTYANEKLEKLDSSGIENTVIMGDQIAWIFLILRHANGFDVSSEEIFKNSRNMAKVLINKKPNVDFRKLSQWVGHYFQLTFLPSSEDGPELLSPTAQA